MQMKANNTLLEKIWKQELIVAEMAFMKIWAYKIGDKGIPEKLLQRIMALQHFCHLVILQLLVADMYFV